jgi:hypothetical protein
MNVAAMKVFLVGGRERPRRDALVASGHEDRHRSGDDGCQRSEWDETSNIYTIWQGGNSSSASHLKLRLTSRQILARGSQKAAG